MNLQAREGDFLETRTHLIFDAKGFVHPPDRVIAYLRYVPDKRGARQKNGIRYRKIYALDKRERLIARKWPGYSFYSAVFNRQVQAIPHSEISFHYIPTRRLLDLQRPSIKIDEKERQSLDLAATIATQAKVSLHKIGVSGSILVGLHTRDSDIDLILYGRRAACRSTTTIRQLLETKSEGFSALNRKDLHKLYSDRDISPRVSFETFVRHEHSKTLQGKFRGVHYFLRCVKDWDEVKEEYGDTKYFPITRTRVRGIIIDDSESIFTPCRYKLADVKSVSSKVAHLPIEIVSYRGRFCEQVRLGDKILAEGRLERVVDQREEIYRLIIGEDPRDHLIVT